MVALDYISYFVSLFLFDVYIFSTFISTENKMISGLMFYM